MTRIAVTGPECSGKSTLCSDLKKSLKAELVEEYARKFLENLGRVYVEKDLISIAEGQCRLIEAAAESGNEHLISDTEMLVMYIWSKVKYGRVNESILQLLNNQKFDLYLLCKPDFDWEPDPLREHPIKDDREALYEQYKFFLEKNNLPFAVMEGSATSRLKKALKRIGTL